MAQALCLQACGDRNQQVSSDLIEKLEQYGAEDGGGTLERFAEFIKAQQAKVTADS